MNLLAIAQALLLACSTPPADPQPHMLSLMVYEATGGDMAMRDPHECVALAKYQQTLHHWRWVFWYAY